MINDDLRPYNPLEKANLGASVAQALLGRPAHALGELPPFVGAGIYALYYRGDFAPYRRLSALNQDANPQAPIYVGKAIPEGGRKGNLLAEGVSTRTLCKRLNEHADSIKAVGNLSIDDVVCRLLVVDDIWIPLGESLLIARFAPLWNVLVDGFGNHDPGKGRYNGLMPRWDLLHPGRVWATRCQPRQESAEQIARDVEARLAQEPSLMRSRFQAAQREGPAALADIQGSPGLPEGTAWPEPLESTAP